MFSEVMQLIFCFGHTDHFKFLGCLFLLYLHHEIFQSTTDCRERGAGVAGSTSPCLLQRSAKKTATIICFVLFFLVCSFSCLKGRCYNFLPCILTVRFTAVLATKKRYWNLILFPHGCISHVVENFSYTL